MSPVTNTRDEYNKFAAVFYDSEDISDRRLCVSISNGSATLTTRAHPSHVWSPPTKLYLDRVTDITKDQIFRTSDNPDLLRDMNRGK